MAGRVYVYPPSQGMDGGGRHGFNRCLCAELWQLQSAGYDSGPVAKFVSEAENGRIGSAFKLGCLRMTVVNAAPPGPSLQPFSDFATGPSREPGSAVLSDPRGSPSGLADEAWRSCAWRGRRVRHSSAARDISYRRKRGRICVGIVGVGSGVGSCRLFSSSLRWRVARARVTSPAHA